MGINKFYLKMSILFGIVLIFAIFKNQEAEELLETNQKVLVDNTDLNE